MDLEGEEEISVQAAYTPESSCWGCGAHACLPACLPGLKLYKRPTLPACCRGLGHAGAERKISAHNHACRLSRGGMLCLAHAGPAAEGGLGLQSFRIPNGLQGRLRLAKKYQAFPQIVNGGVVSALFDCHGNWTAAIALMDRSGLPRPPLTLTSELLVGPAFPYLACT
jgi:hypothetical protein